MRLSLEAHVQLAVDPGQRLLQLPGATLELLVLGPQPLQARAVRRQAWSALRLWLAPEMVVERLP